MKKASLGLAVLTSLALTACGGGGDDAPITTTNPAVTPATPTTPSTPATPNTPVVNPAATGIAGTKMSVSYGTADPASATNATSAINTVVINGENIAFLPAGFTVNQLNMQNTNLNGATIWRVGGSSNLSYTRYGYVKEGLTGEAHLFAQGQVSTNTPTTGTATYTGNGAYLSNGQINLAEAQFNVDYGQKTLNGTVGSTALSATISGNSFSGTKDGVSTVGYFYGANAAELGGTYRNENGTIAGAYAAKK